MFAGIRLVIGRRRLVEDVSYATVVLVTGWISRGGGSGGGDDFAVGAKLSIRPARP